MHIYTNTHTHCTRSALCKIIQGDRLTVTYLGIGRQTERLSQSPYLPYFCTCMFVLNRQVSVSMCDCMLCISMYAIHVCVTCVGGSKGWMVRSRRPTCTLTPLRARATSTGALSSTSTTCPLRKRSPTRRKSPSSPWRSQSSGSPLFLCCKCGTMTESLPMTSQVRIYATTGAITYSKVKLIFKLPNLFNLII